MKEKTCYEVYYIKESVLQLLLAGLGQTEWHGLFSEPEGLGQDSLVKEAANRVLAGMYQAGIVDWDGAGISVRQPYADMLSVMLEKKTCITIQMPDTACSLRCCYVSQENVVMTQKSQREDGTLGMTKLSLRDWFVLLEEECMRLCEGECCLLHCCSSVNGSIYNHIGIRKGGLRTFCLEWDAGGGGRLCCMQEEFVSRLKPLLERPAAALKTHGIYDNDEGNRRYDID